MTVRRSPVLQSHVLADELARVSVGIRIGVGVVQMETLKLIVEIDATCCTVCHWEQGRWRSKRCRAFLVTCHIRAWDKPAISLLRGAAPLETAAVRLGAGKRVEVAPQKSCATQEGSICCYGQVKQPRDSLMMGMGERSRGRTSKAIV
jgi:hypothetical protein